MKADAYGHGAADVGRIAIEEGARALCVSTPGEGLALRAALRGARILVLGPHAEQDVRAIRDARLELAVSKPPFPDGIPLHVKLDTGMGRYGFRVCPELPAGAVGLMSHLATAGGGSGFRADADRALSRGGRGAPRSRGARREQRCCDCLPESRLSAARCGLALYGLSPFGGDPADDGLRPVLSWRTELAQVKLLEPGESTGYGRRFVAAEPTWIGLVPVGYADGFRRDLTGTEVLVDGVRCPVVGAISMDSFAVALPEQRPEGTPVTLLGDGLRAEEHARVADTINYELVCGIRTNPARGRRELDDG